MTDVAGGVRGAVVFLTRLPIESDESDWRRFQTFPAAFPLTAVSNVFVAPELMPPWLGTVAEWNPLSSTVAAARDLFGNPGVGGDSWPASHPLLLAVAWPLLLVAIFAPLAIRRYRRLDR